MTSYQDLGPEEPRGWSPLAVAMIATLVLLLGLAGALFGIYVSNVNAQTTAEASPSASAPAIAPPTSPAVTTSPSGAQPTASAPGPFALPKLAGMNFQDARAKVRELKLGWALKFEGATNDPTVRDTNPPAGTLVERGITITIFVKGVAPLAVVPDIVGKPCAQGADMIVEAGLYPDYRTTARTGTVLSGPTQTALHWNDKMALTCSG